MCITKNPQRFLSQPIQFLEFSALFKNIRAMETRASFQIIKRTYHSVTERTLSNAIATVCLPSFQSFSSFIHVLASQLSGLPKTISHSLLLTFSSSMSHSSPIPIAAAKSPSCFNCSTWSLITETNGETTMMVDNGLTSLEQIALETRGNSWNIKLFPKPVGRIAKTSFPRARLRRHAFCSFLSTLTCGKSRRQFSKTASNSVSSKPFWLF